jgi:aryl-alcohol dehydrogenase-like predicted oxidoreductase
MYRPDYSTDLDETLAVLSDLVRAGKVRAIGSSTFPAEAIVSAQWQPRRAGIVGSSPSSPVTRSSTGGRRRTSSPRSSDTA